MIKTYVDRSYLCFSFQAIAALALNSGCPFKEEDFQEEMLELKKRRFGSAKIRLMVVLFLLIVLYQKIKVLF